MEENVQGVSDAPESIVSDDTQVKKEAVSYETHVKLLGQRKKDLEKLRGLEDQMQSILSEKKQHEEAKLAEQGEYKKLLEQREAELAREREEKQVYQTQMLTAHKLNAFREKLPGKIANSQYYDFVNLEQIAIDPETGAIDDGSVDSAVNDFMKDHSVLVTPKNKASLPQNAPQNVEHIPTSFNKMKEDQKKEVLKGSILELFNKKTNRRN